MPKYLFAYHGGEFPQALAKAQDLAWNTWAMAVGSRLVESGGPLHPGKTVSAGGTVSASGGANPVTGFSIIEAENMEAAIAIARDCPQIRRPHKDGTIEIAELMFG